MRKNNYNKETLIHIKKMLIASHMLLSLEQSKIYLHKNIMH